MRVLKFLLLWAGLTVFFSLVNSSFVKTQILIQSINALLFTAGFYVSYHLLIKPLLYKGKVMRFAVLYLLVLGVLSFISMITVFQVYVLEKNKFYIDNYWNEPVFFTSNYILMLFATSTLLSFRFLKDKMQTQALFENLEKEKISTELGFLKAQINPHFLFNSLNNILFQIERTNKDARDTLLKFSEMLRYQLYECSSDLIEIEKELQYIRNYIEIQMLRKTDRYRCSLDISGSVKNFSIAPLLLIPLIENAFKHVSNHASTINSINISMDYADHEFSFDITNDKDNLSPMSVEEHKGIGLLNVRRRLDLIYNQKHRLEVINGASQFTVHLKLQIA